MAIGVSLPSSLDLRFSAAEKFFAGKIAMTRAAFDALRAQAQLYAFTVARVSSIQVISDIQSAVQRAIVEGSTLADFQKAMPKIMADNGWSGITPWHTETVFRTNVQMSYGIGQIEGLRKVAEVMPFWRYVAIHDSRVRKEHLALDGKIYPADHEFWQTHFPPWAYNCRCDVVPMTADDVGDQKVHTDSGPDAEGFNGPGRLNDLLSEPGITPELLAKTMMPTILTIEQEQLLLDKLAIDEMVPLAEEGPVGGWGKIGDARKLEEEEAARKAIEGEAAAKKERRRLQINEAARKRTAAKRAAKDLVEPEPTDGTPLARLSQQDFRTGNVAGVDFKQGGIGIEGHNLNARKIVDLDGRAMWEFSGKATTDDLANFARTDRSFAVGQTRGRRYYGGKLAEDGETWIEGSAKMSVDYRPVDYYELGPDRVKYFDVGTGKARLEVNTDRWADMMEGSPASEHASMAQSFRIRIPRTGNDASDFKALAQVVKGTPLEEMLKPVTIEERRRVAVLREIVRRNPDLLDERKGLFTPELAKIPKAVKRPDVQGIMSGRLSQADLRGMTMSELRDVAKALGTDSNLDTIAFRDIPELGYSTPTIKREFNYDDFRIWHGSSAPANVVADLVKEGRLTSSLHRIRYGTSGVLNAADMRSGGADSLFTRLLPKNAVGFSWKDSYAGGDFQFIFKAVELERIDVYAYRTDEFGIAYGEQVLDQKAIRHLAEEVRSAYVTNNEVMFRRGVSLENLQEIHATTIANRNLLLGELRARGVSFINGRRIEDVVTVHGERIQKDIFGR